MGKTIKGKDKAARKVAAAKAKIARKTKRACAAILAAALALLCGCATSDSAQPAKSQTQNNTFDECVIVVAAKAAVSNGVVVASADGATPPLEMFTQTQSLESSGTESFAQTATQTPTSDVRPNVDVRYNDAIAGASAASKGVLETLISASANKVIDMMASKSSGTVEVTRKDGTTATVECRDGQCSFCTDCGEPQ
ncbi:MAG: hypothetical protein ACI4RA_10600 [Kiritimatiellia bacterium]